MQLKEQEKADPKVSEKLRDQLELLTEKFREINLEFGPILVDDNEIFDDWEKQELYVFDDHIELIVDGFVFHISESGTTVYTPQNLEQRVIDGEVEDLVSWLNSIPNVKIRTYVKGSVETETVIRDWNLFLNN
jgi:hypothetical protein